MSRTYQVKLKKSTISHVQELILKNKLFRYLLIVSGVGYTLASRLQAMGISTCGEMQNMSAEKLNELGTKTGELLFRWVVQIMTHWIFKCIFVNVCNVPRHSFCLASAVEMITGH